MNLKSQERKVTLIGLGTMGTALARALLTQGFQLTVWNRDRSKADLIGRKGVILAVDAKHAIEASPVTLMCVSDHQASKSILESENTIEALRDRTLVQLSLGTPQDMLELNTMVQAIGGKFLSGGIAAWPEQIGSEEAMITVAGVTDVFKTQMHVLSALAGTIDHVGESPDASAVLTMASMTYLGSSWIGFCQGAVICEKAGIPVDTFGKLMEGFATGMAPGLAQMGRVIRDDQYDNSKSKLKTTAGDLQVVLRHTQEAGLNTELSSLSADIFKRAVDAGYGFEDHAAIVKILRKRN